MEMGILHNEIINLCTSQAFLDCSSPIWSRFKLALYPCGFQQEELTKLTNFQQEPSMLKEKGKTSKSYSRKKNANRIVFRPPVYL